MMAAVPPWGMTAAADRDILHRMKVATLASLLILASASAWGADLDLGFAHPGMSVEEFRASSWPPGIAVRCSGEADLPPESDSVRLTVPQPVARLGGTRCGLFHQQDGAWKPSRLTMAGGETEVWGKFFPDRTGTSRLVQLVLKQPASGFAALAAHLTEHFGEPDENTSRLVRWQTDEAEATIIDDGSKNLLVFIIDTRLQSALNARTSHQAKPKAHKSPHP